MINGDDRDYGQSSPPSGTFQSVGAGMHHTCGVTTSGAVKCWGPDDGGDYDSGQSTPP
jgi:hypothetical protein